MESQEACTALGIPPPVAGGRSGAAVGVAEEKRALGREGRSPGEAHKIPRTHKP